MKDTFRTAREAWDQLAHYKHRVYNALAALYAGDHELLADTGQPGTFWKRVCGRQRNIGVHMPVASDIARTGSDLLFSEAPRFSVYHNGEGDSESDSQKRLDAILDANDFLSTLPEAAETAAALGDVYLKIRWNMDRQEPIIDMVQPDCAWPEYRMNELKCVHFFTAVRTDWNTDRVLRVYERYTEDEIQMEAYQGSGEDLGTRLDDGMLKDMGYEPRIVMPAKGLAAVHIANMRPNRRFRGSKLGRSDLDGLRDLCDALDEAYSSLIRDIRLAKARIIVPMDYLRRRPAQMLDGVSREGSWEFDPDVETYVAMDIDTENGRAGLTPSQFAIRADEHLKTCSDLMRAILTNAGYSPQSFGLDINGSAQSGTALSIREHKSASTRSKKQMYWQSPLERFLTFLLKLDSVLYPRHGSDGNDVVRMSFSDSMGFDLPTMAQSVAMLNNAAAVSDDTKVRMLHPDWSEQQITAELERLNAQTAREARMYSLHPDVALEEQEE